ncbi:hypothetical protein C1Y40_03970 [Mycobacterium talmoniae]|uniref:Uncharacterized protein n=1 Tax=Mycobacterium talmoniae TaxID=1858794 RepID=A0A2S8BGS3_9MYCO|nr:hypothetical protein C1Y40_03970 [Mycobacterium talmoniae]
MILSSAVSGRWPRSTRLRNPPSIERVPRRMSCRFCEVCINPELVSTRVVNTVRLVRNTLTVWGSTESRADIRNTPPSSKAASFAGP